MKFLIVVSALLVVALADDHHGIKAVHEKCQSVPATHVDESVFKDLRKNHDKAVLPANFGKHVLCMSEGLHLVKDGKISEAGVKTHIEHSIHEADKVEKILKECAVDEATAEETSKHVWMCLHQNHVFGGSHHGSSESGSDESGEHHHGHH